MTPVPTKPLREMLAEAYVEAGRDMRPAILRDEVAQLVDLTMHMLAEYDPCFAKAAEKLEPMHPELLAAVRHIDSIANSDERPTTDDYRTSHSLLVKLVLAHQLPRVDLGL